LRLPPVYPILDTASLSRVNLTAIDAAEAFLEAGAQILQFRHKGFWNRDIVADAEAVSRLCLQTGARFVINDRADYAAMIGAGLHVGQQDLAPADARRVVGPHALIGFSTHNIGQMRAAAAEPVDYVAFGPVFTTASKERPDPEVGVHLLRIVRALTSRPLVAIGGINPENAAECWRAGADSVAVIASLIPEEPTKAALRRRMAIFLREAETCRT
jgi:thiamine-phosphate pyrophosphorylase